MLEMLFVLMTLGSRMQDEARVVIPHAIADTDQGQPALSGPSSVLPIQVASGQFTTAAEVRPILEATRSSWVGVRDYDGHDLVYVTQIWSWRCGLSALSIGINDEPLQNWPLPPCHEGTATPNAILPEDGLPFLRMQSGSVAKVVIELTYDDGTRDRAEFPRASVLIP
jgi:hypothetical protein